MAEDYLRQSALAHLHLAARATADPGGAGVLLSERPFRGHLVLRGDGGDDTFRAAAEGALGVALPLEPNRTASRGGTTALWQGPDEWLIALASPDQEGPAATLRQALGDRHAAVTAVGHGLAVIGLAGAQAREVLMKGSGLDFHPEAFLPGRCARTLLARASVGIHLRDAAPEFDVRVARSFADYLWAWLEDAGAEYGVAVVRG